jgi:hypothetical protein
MTTAQINAGFLALSRFCCRLGDRFPRGWTLEPVTRNLLPMVSARQVLQVSAAAFDAHAFDLVRP